MLWAQGDVSEDMAALWTAAIVHPVDCGEMMSDKQGERKRKLRPRHSRNLPNRRSSILCRTKSMMQ